MVSGNCRHHAETRSLVGLVGDAGWGAASGVRERSWTWSQWAAQGLQGLSTVQGLPASVSPSVEGNSRNPLCSHEAWHPEETRLGEAAAEGTLAWTGLPVSHLPPFTQARSPQLLPFVGGV